MRLRFGLISNLALSFIALTLALQAANHFSDSDFKDAVFRKQEYDRVILIAQQIEPHIQHEEYRLRLSANAILLGFNAVALTQAPKTGEDIADQLQRAAVEDNLDFIETTDAEGRLVFRTQAPIIPGERSTQWGTDEALQGTPTTSTAPVTEGAMIIHSEPIRQGTKIIGTVTAGRQIGKNFVNTLSTSHGSDVALVSRKGITVASNRRLEGSIDADAITEAFTQKIPVYRFHPQRQTTQVYFPLQIIDDGWILLTEIDSASTMAAKAAHDRLQALFAFAVVCASILAMFITVWFALRPLRALRAHAEALYHEMSGEPITSTQSLDDIEGLVRILNAQTGLLMRRNQELSGQRADLRISSKAFETQQPTVITDTSGRVLKANQAYAQMSGYGEEESIGTRVNIFNTETFNTELAHALAQTGHWQGEWSARRKSGEDYPVKISVNTVQDENGLPTHRIITFVDLSEHNSITRKLQELSRLDALTELPNRTQLIERLRHTTLHVRQPPSISALLMIDLDHFKSLNDTQGHATGDELIRKVGQRLSATVRTNDTVARIGGDEFAIILDGIATTADEAKERTALICAKLQEKLNESHILNDSEYRGTCSLGATVFGPHEASAATLMMQADLALHQAKSQGRNLLCFFNPCMQEQAIERVALEQSLQEALNQQQFILHYQPQVTATGEVLGAEALIRWQHPERGMVPPGAFIPLAEESGEIIAIGRWVLQSACEQLQKWAAEPRFAHLTIAVNVCARQLHHPDFVEHVLSTIDETGANPQRLKLELTESMLVEHAEALIFKMETLRNRGLCFSLDDFGTGYSSLTYLKRLPIEQLKIDQSFVRDVLSDPNDAVIAKSIVGLAQNLGLKVIAEGVETREQQEFLLGLGCTTYQGYFFSRPLVIESFEDFIRQRATVSPDRAPGLFSF